MIRLIAVVCLVWALIAFGGSAEGGTASTSFDLTVTSEGGGVSLVNGSFEDPIVNANDGSHQYYTGSEVPGWLITGDIDIVRDAFEAGEGSQAMDLNGTNAGSVSQTLTGLTIGTTYQLSVQWARHPSGSGVRSADVIVNGDVVGTLSTSTKLPPYKTSTFDFTPAPDGSVEIAFVSTSLNTSVGIVIDDVQLSVATGNNAPSISSITAQTNAEGETASLQVNASDPDGDTLSYSATELPNGLTIDSSTGLISGTLSMGSQETYNITVAVYDGNGAAASTSFDWTVTSEGDGVSLVNGSFEDPIVNANDGSHQYYTGSEVPGWLITGDIDIVRDAFEAGEGSQAMDLNGTNAGSVSQTLTGLTIGTTYQLSVQWARHPSGSGVRSADVIVNGDVVGTLSTSTKLPPYKTSTFDFTPAPDGSVEIAFVSTSLNTSVGIVIDDVQLSVATGNNAPSISSITAQTNAEGETVSLQVNASDPDGDTLSYSATGLPSGLTIDSSTGLISGTLSTDSQGTYNVIVTVDDGNGGTDSTSFDEEVNAPTGNTPPSISSINAQTDAEGETMSLQVSASDPDGDALSYSAAGLPAGLTIDSSTGLVSGTLSSGSQGTYNVTVAVDDGNGGTASTSLDWTVTTESETSTSLANGSFEDPIVTANDGSHQYYTDSEVPGWLITGDIDIVRDAFEAGEGSQAVDLNGNNAGSVSQTLTDLTVGTTYQLSVKWARHPSGSGVRSADVMVNGDVVGTLSTSTKLPPYKTSTFDFTPAPGGSAKIAFVSTSPNTSVGIVIDDVQLMIDDVPLMIDDGPLSDGSDEPSDLGPDPRPAADVEGNLIPDFSRVGYRDGREAIPDVPTVRELSPRSSGDDTDRIQAALDDISEVEPDETGFRGALLLKAGTYRVNRHLQIRHSGVVLRGEGQTPDGTTIVATGTDHHVFGRNDEHSLIYLGEHTNSDTSFLTRDYETRLVENVPVGSRVIGVENASGFAVGDEIAIQVFPNDKWLEMLDLETKWNAGLGARAVHERRITAIDGNRLTLDVPMTWHLEMGLMDRVEVWSFSRDKRISKIGVEQVRLVGFFNKDNYDDLANWKEIEHHARSGIYIEPVRDAWVRNVTALHFHFAAVDVAAGARNVTIQDSAFLRPVSRIKGGKRYAFHVLGSRVLAQRCYAREARHAFASGPAAYGPNVFLDCLAEKNFHESGPHTKWATGFLYDNVTVEDSTLQAKRATSGSHGWQGANHVFWNSQAAQLIADDPETRDTNWSIGAIAARGTSGKTFSPGHWISQGSRVAQRSLYLWDLQNRLGPRAVERVTTTVQRQGTTAQINQALQDELAELTPREQANEGNLLLDYAFQVAGRASPWYIPSGPDEGTNVASLPRTTNPVYGDNSAITVPANNALQNGYFYLAMDVATGSPTSYVLEFDYRLEDAGNIEALVTQQRIDHSDEWQKVANIVHGESAVGGSWKHFRFDFDLEPALDMEGFPYTHILRVQLLKTDTAYSIANPVLTVVE